VSCCFPFHDDHLFGKPGCEEKVSASQFKRALISLPLASPIFVMVSDCRSFVPAQPRKLPFSLFLGAATLMFFFVSHKRRRLFLRKKESKTYPPKNVESAVMTNWIFFFFFLVKFLFSTYCPPTFFLSSLLLSMAILNFFASFPFPFSSPLF